MLQIPILDRDQLYPVYVLAPSLCTRFRFLPPQFPLQGQYTTAHAFIAEYPIIRLFSSGEWWLTERTRQIGVRLPRKDVLLLKRICRSRGEDLSDFIRRAIRTELAKLSFLSALDKKALGVKAEGDSGD
jgi:hypothetical protein